MWAGVDLYGGYSRLQRAGGSPEPMFWSTTSITVSMASGEMLWLITGSSVYSFS